MPKSSSSSILRTPHIETGLVVFFDLTGFAQISRGMEPDEIFNFMARTFSLAGEIIEPAGGWLVKPIGDAGMVFFSDDKIEAGVQAMLKVKNAVDKDMEKNGHKCRLIVKMHYGPVARGTIGTATRRFEDIYGETINMTATMASTGLAISPQVFRKLGPNARKLFKKHTPPVRYIPVTERHKD